MENDEASEGRAPLGSWRAFHTLVLAILAALILGYSAVSWIYQ
jgi:hypothetical protein